MASPPQAPATVTSGYQEHDKVEVQWQGQWYKSTIIGKRGDNYRIHYDGYADSWDEWVTADRIRR